MPIRGIYAVARITSIVHSGKVVNIGATKSE